MLDAGAPSQAKRTPDFGRYLPLSVGGGASNRAGSTSEELTVRPVTFGSIASFITSGMEAAGGLWAGQLLIAVVSGLAIILAAIIKGGILAPVMAFIFAALFAYTAGYWLAAMLTVLMLVAVVSWVALEKA